MRIIIHFYLFDFQFCDIHLTKGNGKFPFILFYSYFDMWFRFAFYLFNKSLIFICNNHDDSIFFFSSSSYFSSMATALCFWDFVFVECVWRRSRSYESSIAVCSCLFLTCCCLFAYTSGDYATNLNLKELKLNIQRRQQM